MTDIIPVNLSRLQTTLINSGLQIKDNSLYQVINQLITYLEQLNQAGGKAISNITPSNGGKTTIPIVIPGLDGLDGEDGIIGPAGKDGITGSQGPAGALWPLFDGLDGEDGIFGIPGPPGDTGPAGSSDIIKLRGTLTEAQLESWFSSPITLLGAQGANTVIVPIHFSFQQNTTTAYSSNPTAQLVWGTTGPNLLATAIAPTFTAIRTTFKDSAPANISLDYLTFDARNQALTLLGSADPGNPGVGVATAVWNLIYYVATTA